MDVMVKENDVHLMMRPRTLEEAIAYENFTLLRSGAISVGISVPNTLSEAYQDIYDRIRSDNFKKTDFAMSLLAGNGIWSVPVYIAEGLVWLETRLCGPAPNVGVPETTSEISA